MKIPTSEPPNLYPLSRPPAKLSLTALPQGPGLQDAAQLGEPQWGKGRRAQQRGSWPPAPESLLTVTGR